MPLVVIVLSMLAAAAAAWADGPSVVTPGTVVTWPGDGIERCGIGSTSWPALASRCWYAVDLLHEPGTVEVWRRRQGRLETMALEVGEYGYPVQYIQLENDSQVNLSAADLRRVREEQGRVGALWSSVGSRRFTLPLQPPLEEIGPGGRFGSRRFFNDQPRSPHSGADYAAAQGEPVFGVAPGRVVLADDLFFSGKSLFLDHGDGLISMYFHLSAILTEEGSQVAAGQMVGRVGATGRATGPHLHFGLRWRRARIDPALLFGAPEDVPSVGAVP